MKDAFDADQAARNKIVAEREAAGIFPENTEAYKNTLAFLNDKLVKGRQPAERVKIDVTEQGVKNAYERVREAMLNKRVMMEGTEAEVAQQVAAIQQAGGKVVRSLSGRKSVCWPRFVDCGAAERRGAPNTAPHP